MFLGPGARFDGKLTFKGTVRVDTVFKGTITTNDVLLVGERAALEANVSCGSVVVSGSVTGNIEARTSVELAPTARVKGDVDTPSLVVQKGAVLTGGVSMTSGGDGARPRAHPPARRPAPRRSRSRSDGRWLGRLAGRPGSDARSFSADLRRCRAARLRYDVAEPGARGVFSPTARAIRP